jgi:hypothetical protein
MFLVLFSRPDAIAHYAFFAAYHGHQKSAHHLSWRRHETLAIGEAPIIGQG